MDNLSNRQLIKKKRKLDEREDYSDIENSPQDKRIKLTETDEEYLSSDSENTSLAEGSIAALSEERYPLSEISVKKNNDSSPPACNIEVGFEPLAIGFESLSPGEIFNRHLKLPGLIDSIEEVSTKSSSVDSGESSACIASTSSAGMHDGNSKIRSQRATVVPDSDSDESFDFHDDEALISSEDAKELEVYSNLTLSSESESNESYNDSKSNLKIESCPFPKLKWSNEERLWAFLNKKNVDSLNGRDYKYFLKHPSIHKRMRSVLLEWLLEVCSVYKLQRETFYLSVDYLDRFLSSYYDVCKKELQLFGVTCLLIAAKVEEIYPPKVTEFAYITDGAYTESDILSTEHKVMDALDWKTVAYTPNSWLILMYQLITSKEDLDKLNWQEELRSAFKILDLFSLHELYIKYSYKTIATSILCLLGYREQSLNVSGLSWNQISGCVRKMQVFQHVLKKDVRSDCKNTSESSWTLVCNDQIDMNVVDNVEAQLQKIKKEGCDFVLTPPYSCHKKELD